MNIIICRSSSFLPLKDSKFEDSKTNLHSIYGYVIVSFMSTNAKNTNLSLTTILTITEFNWGNE